MNRVIQIAINGLALWVAVILLRPGLDFDFAHNEWWKFVLVAIVFSLVNTYLRPILRIVTLPISILTLGLFLIVINALMLVIVGAISEQLSLGFAVSDFWSAILGAVIISVVGWVLAVALAPARVAGRVV